MSIRRLLSATAACLLAAGVAVGTPGAEPDADTGLAVAPGWEDVRVHCGACHSFGLITNQRANREGWRDMIRWMQRTQNLWELPADSETRILDYLAENYAPQTLRRRRPPIPPELMPAADAADASEEGVEGSGSAPGLVGTAVHRRRQPAGRAAMGWTTRNACARAPFGHDRVAATGLGAAPPRPQGPPGPRRRS